MENKKLSIVEAEPNVNNVKYGKEIGKTPPTDKFIYLPCPRCNKPRWVRLTFNKPVSKYCAQCHKEATYKKPTPRYRENHPRWKGGRLITTEGYIIIHLQPSHRFFCMARANVKGYVLEHRLVMAEHLDRPLLPKERVHHLNGIKDDNRIENLELFENIGKHIALHNKGYREGYRKGYEDGQQVRIKELTQEIRLLRLEVKQLKGQNIVR